MVMSYLQVRLDPVIKSETEAVLEQLGLTMTQAVKLFFKQVIMRKSIPFPVVIPKTSRVYATQEEEQMIEESLMSLSKGKKTAIDMSNEAQVKKHFLD